ncbi:MAG: hypothetical protein CMC95_05465 [Flavobacteriales bacterium]|nr:hypothetical protein [Flavobacteriales bacterium]
MLSWLKSIQNLINGMFLLDFKKNTPKKHFILFVFGIFCSKTIQNPSKLTKNIIFLPFFELF